jgi:hypothetical protein
MKKLVILALVTLVATPAFAQETADMGVFFDQAGTQTTACWASFTQTNHFYAVAFDIDLAGFELGLIIDPTIIIFNSAMVAGAGPINVGAAPDNWIVGTGSCVSGVGGAVVLLDFTAGYFVAPVADLLICVTPSSPASLQPAVPAYLTCQSDILPFGVAASGSPDYPDGCGVLCPTGEAPIATDATSWGSLKGAY